VYDAVINVDRLVSFNSIEWILLVALRLALERLRSTFNSIEWIPYPETRDESFWDELNLSIPLNGFFRVAPRYDSTLTIINLSIPLNGFVVNTL